MWTSAQAPLFLFAGAPAYIYKDIGGVEYWVWFVAAHLLATAAISPFVGAISDFIGRRYVALAGSLCIMVGQVICGFAHNMDTFIGGMAMTGIGTGVNELTVIAGTSELVPISQRGYYLAAVTLTITPYIPSVMYAQLIASNSTWRFIAVLTSGSALIAFAMTFMFYSPPLPPVASHHSTMSEKMALVKRMDLFGGFLSISGLALLEIGILGGGYRHPWTDGIVLAPLVIGIVLIIIFLVWELRFAANPMIPKRFGKKPRTLLLTMVITFISGANFFSVLMIWPSEAYNVYGHDPIGVGIRGLPFAFGTLAGCLISLVLLSVLRGNIRWILLGSSVVMTAGCGGLAAARVDNIHTVYGILFVAGLGVGGIVVPASTVTTYICPSDLLATITSLTIAIRIVGGAVGYAVYFNLFVNQLKDDLPRFLAPACMRIGITNPEEIGQIIGMTAESLIDEIRSLRGMEDEAAYQSIVEAGQLAYTNAYPLVFYASIGFGAVSILASLFLEDVSEFVSDQVVADI
ncbi:major facilitator superfamily domain-containing protein [Immersiella caudata]|uniref:Major facilitator superfamily domain-containing protein n=1 Tax=Immersiella caudata TaxID=314043 RepID=A0AA40CDN2_9PEZI|nr:major facilitator superfamily domain-containing protein [Immersiella caudata]